MAFESVLPANIRKLQRTNLAKGDDGQGSGSETIRSLLNGLFADADPATKKSINDALSSALGGSADGFNIGDLGGSTVLQDTLDSLNQTAANVPQTVPAASSAEQQFADPGLISGSELDAGGYEKDGFTTEYGNETVSSKTTQLTKLHPTAAAGIDQIVNTFGQGRGVGGYRTLANDSIKNGDHPKGLAFDWSSPSIQQGTDVFNYVIGNATQMKVKYVIFNGRIWSPDGGNRQYVPPAGEGDHSDHVHVSYYP